MCETWSLTLREERRLRVFENRVLRRIFGPKRDEVKRPSRWSWPLINILHSFLGFCYCEATTLSGHRPPHCWDFKFIHRNTTLGRTPPDEGSAPLRTSTWLNITFVRDGIRANGEVEMAMQQTSTCQTWMLQKATMYLHAYHLPIYDTLLFDVITSLVSMEHGVYGCEKVTSLGEVTSNGLAWRHFEIYR
jgi:hypothetical protein